MGVAGYELGVADAGGGVDDGVHGGEAMVEADGGSGEGDGFVEGNDFLVHDLRDEAVGDGLAAKLRELLVNLEENYGGDQYACFRLKVVTESGSFRILREIFEPAGRIHDEEFRSAA